MFYYGHATVTLLGQSIDPKLVESRLPEKCVLMKPWLARRRELGAYDTLMSELQAEVRTYLDSNRIIIINVCTI